MPQFKLYTFFFLVLSAILATSTPTCSRWNHCSKSSACLSTKRIPYPTAALPTKSIGSSAIPSQVPTQSLGTPTGPNPTSISSSHAPAPSSPVTGNTSNADIQAYLTPHNNMRAQHGAKPLEWSDSLASKALQWANRCVFEHSEGRLGPFGENLAAGTGSFGIGDAVWLWNDEEKDYNPKNPEASHFTQVVWKATTRIGCAVQTCPVLKNFSAGGEPAKFYICEYSPAGNVIGSFSENIQV